MCIKVKLAEERDSGSDTGWKDTSSQPQRSHIMVGNAAFPTVTYLQRVHSGWCSHLVEVTRVPLVVESEHSLSQSEAADFVNQASFGLGFIFYLTKVFP